MKLDFADYHGPTGAYVATDRGLLPLTSPDGMAALMDSQEQQARRPRGPGERGGLAGPEMRSRDLGRRSPPGRGDAPS